MVRTDRWKYVHFLRHPPMLFDLKADPGELDDLGRDPAFGAVRAELKDRLFDWFCRRRLRVTIADDTLAALTGKAHARGYLFGVW